MAARYLEKFESIDGLTSYVFPLKQYDWQSSQPLLTLVSSAIGADYGYDPQRAATSPLQPAKETVRLLLAGSALNTNALIDTELDNIRSKCYTVGRGKLWTLTAAGVRRWCYARMDKMPDFSVRVGDLLKQAVSLSFTRYSPWYTQAATAATVVAAATPTAFTITNPGNQAAYLMQLRFRSNVAAGWATFTLLNTVNLYQLQYLRAASSINDECRVDTERMSCERSTDDGVTYTDDFAQLVIPTTQVAFMRLEPGANTMSLTITGGTPNLNLDYTFFGPNF